MNILAANVGSTSLKFKLFQMPGERVLCEAKAERIGSKTRASYWFENKRDKTSIVRKDIGISSFADGIRMFIGDMTGESGVLKDVAELSGIGYKAVLSMGYYGVHIVDDALLKALADAEFLSPTHTKTYLNAIAQFREILPETPMVCSFETAFHETIPLWRRIYPIPYEWTERYGILRRGYHGASHSYIAYEVSRRMGRTGRLISCHLGGSSSMCAIYDGKSVDNSFGFSLQTGLPHGKRVGDMDSYIIPYLLKQGIGEEELYYVLNNYSGLAGISGIGDDMREILEAQEHGNERAKLAIDFFVNEIVKCFGAFYAELGGLDYLVFTGGIGENSPDIRARVLDCLSAFGVRMDADKNSNLRGEGCISTEDSSAGVFVLPTNEELMIARNTYSFISKAEDN